MRFINEADVLKKVRFNDETDVLKKMHVGLDSRMWN